MILRFLRRGATRERLVQALRGRIDTAARAPRLYEQCGVPDTVEGRFETICLHVILVLRRLRHLPPPAEDVAQDLIDALFAHLDAALREIGIGDMGVPKRMKKLAGVFYARAVHYDAAIDAGDATALAAVLARNVFDTDAADTARCLAHYVFASEEALSKATLDELLTSGPRFPEPMDEVRSQGRFV